MKKSRWRFSFLLSFTNKSQKKVVWKFWGWNNCKSICWKVSQSERKKACL